MKLIVAIVRPFTIDKILTAFEEIEGFPGMTVTASEGFGKGLGNESAAVNPFRENNGSRSPPTTIWSRRSSRPFAHRLTRVNGATA